MVRLLAVVSLAAVGVIASTEFGGGESGVAVVVGVAVVAEAVSLAEGATSSTDVASNTLVISVSVESGSVEAVVGVGDESVATVGVLELSILRVESVIDNTVVLLTGVTVTIVVVAETGRIIDVVLALSLVGRLVVGVGGVLTLVDIIDDLVVLLTVVSSLVTGVLGSGIIDVVSALDVVTLVATVLIGTSVVESSEAETSLAAEDTFAAEAIEATEALESTETVLVSLAAPSLGGAPAVGSPTALGTPVVDVGVTIAIIAVSALDTVKVVVLGGSNVSVVVTITTGLTAEVKTVEVAGLVLATGALAVAVVNGFGVATTSSFAVVEAGDALVIDVDDLLGVWGSINTLGEALLTRVTADSGALAERASGASAGGGDGAVDVLSTESAVATAETSLATLTGVSADSGASAEGSSGASASGGLGAVDVVATIAAANTVATIGLGATVRAAEIESVTEGSSSDTSKSAESERLEHFVCRDYDKLFKSLAFKYFFLTE